MNATELAEFDDNVKTSGAFSAKIGRNLTVALLSGFIKVVCMRLIFLINKGNKNRKCS